MRDAEPFVADILQQRPDEAGWWVWYVILRATDSSANDVLIGNLGFGGLPVDGTAVVG